MILERHQEIALKEVVRRHYHNSELDLQRLFTNYLLWQIMSSTNTHHCPRRQRFLCQNTQSDSGLGYNDFILFVQREKFLSTCAIWLRTLRITVALVVTDHPSLHPLGFSRFLTQSWQTQGKIQQSRVIRRAQSRDRIPARHGREPWGPAALITTASNVVQDGRVGVQDGVEEAEGLLGF